MALDQQQTLQQDRIRLLKTSGYKIKFPGQHENEQVVLTLRRHISAFLFEMLIIFGAVFLPIGGYIVLSSFLPDLLDPPNSNVLLLILSLYSMFCFLYFFLIWIDRYFDVWVITNERLIDVEQKSFFNRVSSETELDKIQDVTVEVKGFFPTLFRFGNVYVQTAGTQRNFEIQDVKFPYVVKDILIELERSYSNQRAVFQAQIQEQAIQQQHKENTQHPNKSESHSPQELT